MHIWQQSQNDGADDDDDDYDEDEDGDEYNWNDDDTRIGQAHQYGEEDYYTDDENDLEAPRIGARPTLGGQKGRGGATTAGEDGEDDDDEDTRGDIGHWLAKLFKGATVGRKIKRMVLNFTGWQLFFGFSLLVIACDESTNYQPGVGTGWFTTCNVFPLLLHLSISLSDIFPTLVYSLSFCYHLVVSCSLTYYHFLVLPHSTSPSYFLLSPIHINISTFTTFLCDSQIRIYRIKHDLGRGISLLRDVFA